MKTSCLIGILNVEVTFRIRRVSRAAIGNSEQGYILASQTNYYIIELSYKMRKAFPLEMIYAYCVEYLLLN
jgi:hypothetical protein